MKSNIPQNILDALTRVDMPKVDKNKVNDETLLIDGIEVPVYRCEALVLGSGAAGLRAAVELKRKKIDVTIASTGLFSGTSACSGSDKQTLHTAGTSKHGDRFVQLSKDISSGGCMDLDTAYAESVGSIKAFAGLQYMGLPLPEDKYGAVLRYQTDHDEVGRATSCGPRTSRLMVKVLCEEALSLGVSFLKQCEGIRIVKTTDENGSECVRGVLVIDKSSDKNDYHLSFILCQYLVLATGGPGELYRDSVYPKHCYGSLGMAIEAGIEVCNLTECQFGIGTRREEFPWNLSGTYVQVLPYIYSVDNDGNEYNFLADYYRTTQELASNVFRKGYQWPFHASRMENYGSSLVDLAIFIESKKGRKVYMDFNRNPEPVPGDLPFSLDRLDEDVYVYLKNNEALQSQPIERLLQMNPLSIELYKMHKRDITKEPLLFNVNHQHMNGGIDIDTWGKSSLNGCYAVGEVAGSHGVTRPGGAALNAGQVFAMRCADHIANQSDKKDLSINDQDRETIQKVIFDIQKNYNNNDGLSSRDVQKEVQSRMSDYAGFICHTKNIDQAFVQAVELRKSIESRGLTFSNYQFVSDIFRWKHMSLLSEAVLLSLQHYAKNGGGSRGARAMCSQEGEVAPETRLGFLNDFQFIKEKECDKGNKITLCWNGESFHIYEKPIRNVDDLNQIFFEKNWGNYLVGEIYQS